MLESIIMSHQWLLQEQGQVEAIRFMWIIKYEASKLVVSCHKRKLAKHEKEIREKKTKRGKERTFHNLSLSITSTLTFQPCTTLSPITRSTRNEKYKEEEEE